MLIFKTMIVNDCVNKKKNDNIFLCRLFTENDDKEKKIKNYSQQIVITFQRRRF